MGRSITIAILAAAVTLAAPLATYAAGLGRLTVQSSLGQPLNAEIEIVSLQPGEEEGLVARLAAPEAFAQAGIELNPVLLSLRFAVERRDGRALLRLTSTGAVSEPFLDLLVELRWNTGRLVREYTFLLDPPEYKQRQTIAATPAPAPPAVAPSAKPLSPMVEKPQAAPKARPDIRPEGRPAARARTPAKTYEVKKGDTLSGIARQNLPAGVTLNQMLIAIFRANENAFIRGNINLVRSGRILNLPDADSIGTLDRKEANKLVSSHIQQFNEYRGRLAAMPKTAEGTAGRRAVSGRIEPKPAKPPAAMPDQLRLSKADPKKPASPAAKAAAGDNAAARERALKEAQSRQTELEKNVADLQKLMVLKNQQLAELEKKAAAMKPAPVTPKPAAPAAVPAPAAKAPAVPAPAPQAPKPAVVDPKPAAEAPKPAAVAPKPAAPKPAASPTAKPVPKPRPKAPEPSLLDEFLENQLALGGLGAILVLLTGYGFWAWRRKKAAHSKFQDSVLGAAAAGTGGAASLAEPTMDLSSISLDLGSGDETIATGQTSTDPKWQEVATKLDLAKAYEEMGDKDGARELLNEVIKDGDEAQKGQAKQLLSKLG